MAHQEPRFADPGEFAAADPSPRLGGPAAVTGLLLLSAALVLGGLRDHSGELAAAGGAALLLSRGLAHGRRTRTAVLAGIAALLVVARIAIVTGHSELAMAATLLMGGIAVLPGRPPVPTGDGGRRHIWALVQDTRADSIAPFALRSDKSHVLSPDGRAAVAYRVRLGTAVASGDPVGAAASRADAAAQFVRHAHAQGWRPVVLATREDQLPLWRAAGLRAVPIGRDVRLRVDQFDLSGRRFRNLRQAVSRSHNAGVTTQVIPESEVSAALHEDLLAVVHASGRSPTPRGFSMMLDGLLDGTQRGTFLVVARNADGIPVAFQRFATADGGAELSLDLPYRSPQAPNGTDERLAVDVVGWAASRGLSTVSLAFAPFPELFAAGSRTVAQTVAYWLVHRLDPVLRVESLYRYLRKFHALADRRYIAFRPADLPFAAAAALWLEFGRPANSAPRRRWLGLARGTQRPVPREGDQR